MKFKYLFSTLLAVIILSANSSVVFSQTLGWLTFSTNTTASMGNWGNKHVVAIWVENTANPSVFIKTRMKLGNEDDHLTSWWPKSSGNTVDAITGATPTSYGTHTITWDGKDLNHQIVADGTYKVFIEMGWGADKVNQHSVMGFEFTKGPTADHQTPTGNTHFSNVSVDWVPSAVFVEEAKAEEAPTLFPNPSTGVVNLHIETPLQEGEVVVLNSVGSVVYKENIKNGFTGNYAINLSGQSNGLYFVKVVTSKNSYIFKTVIYK